ncbi:MAG: VWA domain-containing protein, partial [Pseudomonadota bacterium]
MIGPKQRAIPTVETPAEDAGASPVHEGAGRLPDTVGGGQIADNIMHFGRVLRRAGLPVGPGHVLEALKAVTAIGPGNRDDFYWALHAVFVNRQDQRELFDQAFHIFWRNPQLLERAMAMLLPTIDKPPDPSDQQEEMSRRLADAMGNQGDPPPAQEEEETEIDATLTWSDREILQSMDFEKMSSDEMAAAQAALARLKLPLGKVKTRRFRPSRAPVQTDMRNTLRNALRGGSGFIDLQHKRHRTRPPPFVILCDISGSMSNYARMLLHFLHALTNDRDRVHTFLFGTRLTNVTRYLRGRDI